MFSICLHKKNIYWKQWNLSGISQMDDLYKNCVFMSYTLLTKRYALTGKEHFLKYLKMKSCFEKGTQKSSPITDFFILPEERLKSSIAYRLTNELLSNSCDSLRGIWQKDLGCLLIEEEWLNLLSDTGKFVRESRSIFTKYKIIHRYFWTTTRRRLRRDYQ